MHAVALTPLHDAPAELELAVAIVLLAEQEGQAIGDTLPRLRRALASVGGVRDPATELAADTGRPALCVIDGGRSSSERAPDAA
ncbi:MAG: hypothetical protein A2V88_16155 [Elusimicrobia bacterium RBG_16_66_12]|nr:MAG: hypothetical protein A2V88_16155 [Elusimicrobia bacterium RBG_16_66_12]